MNPPIHTRLQREHELLQAALPRFAGFVADHAAAGSPPTTHRFRLRPFGLRVRAAGEGPPVAWDPERHGEIELVLCADPAAHPWRPWAAHVLVAGDAVVFSPHVGSAPGARGAVCWLDARPYEPLAWPLPAVLCQVLRILAGEVYALEGFALQEDAKVWFAANAGQLPFARVPDVGDLVQRMLPSAALAASDPLAGRATSTAAASALGIEFDGPAATTARVQP